MRSTGVSPRPCVGATCTATREAVPSGFTGMVVRVPSPANLVPDSHHDCRNGHYDRSNRHDNSNLAGFVCGSRLHDEPSFP